ncbi:MAG: endo alpha-1,4 polygalactosaminidase [Candidatus Eremiobacteraeota bacterium]|nr:endo alpha-1,4 polygalactosaminidase [Candidatus Eremiobacteraeota bacterium]
MLAGCAQAPPPDRFQAVKSFACQLQNLDLKAVPAVDLFIMDPTREGSNPYTAQEIAGLRSGGRLLLAYLSVGEAENYRSYWQKSWKPGQPAWLGPTNPEWRGNYKVRYWDPAWRRIVTDNARQIQAQGFDGLFLDVVDGWEYWQKDHPRAKQAMIDLVLEINREYRHLALVLNGGDGLLDDPKLLTAITGVAKEEIFFGLNGDGKVTPSPFTRDCQARLRKLVDAHKLVLSIDYTQDPAQKRAAYERARQSGYLEFIGARGLDSIPPQE